MLPDPREDMMPPEVAQQHSERAAMYATERLRETPRQPVQKSEPFQADEQDDEDVQEDILQMPSARPAAAPRAAAQPALSVADQAAIAFWRKLNEAEQNWLTDAGDTARGLIKWASKLSRKGATLKVRVFSGEGADRKAVMTSSVRYVSVEIKELTTLFVLEPEALPPEIELGTPVEVEFDGNKQELLAGFALGSGELPFPMLVFFPNDGQS